MDIARKEGYNEIIARLSGLGPENCNIHGKCDCNELRQILFNSSEKFKTDDFKKLKKLSTEDGGESIASHLEEKIRRTSESRVLKIEQSWQERLELARAEVLAHCETRIAEVEHQCKEKVAMVEQRCSERLQAAKSILANVVGDRAPSAPGRYRRDSLASVYSSDSSDFYSVAHSL